MDVQTVILGFLMQHEMSGYDLKQVISISFSFFSKISYGSIYPALKKLNQHRMVSMRLMDRENGPTRKVYAITPAGRDFFLEALTTPIAYDSGRKTFLPRLFFFAHLPAETRRELTLGFRQSIQDVMTLLQSTQPEIEAKADPFQRLCAQFGDRMLADLAANVDQTLQELQDLSAKENQ